MKSIQDLIQEGYSVKTKCIHHNEYGLNSISGEEYARWLMVCSRYLGQYDAQDPQIKQFIETAKNANGRYERDFEELMGILQSIGEIPPIKVKSNDIDNIDKICTNFHRYARALLNRRGGRAALEINDEYDVQYLLEGMLRLFFDDVRVEDYVASYAGSNSRIDFYLPQINTYIETKMTRVGLQDKEVGEELSIDITRYGEKCDKLICFIYDKESLLKNPYGLIDDLKKLSSSRLEVEVYISPL